MVCDTTGVSESEVNTRRLLVEEVVLSVSARRRVKRTSKGVDDLGGSNRASEMLTQHCEMNMAGGGRWLRMSSQIHGMALSSPRAKY